MEELWEEDVELEDSSPFGGTTACRQAKTDRKHCCTGTQKSDIFHKDSPFETAIKTEFVQIKLYLL